MTILTIVVMSDTHECHREVQVPDGDLLIHAGDFTMFSKSHAAIRDFDTWLGQLPHALKVVVPGNHEYFLEADQSKRWLISNAVTLINQSTVFKGLKIWGSPTTALSGGAFGLSSAADRRSIYSTIPADTDVIVTHGPPYGILDRSPDSAEPVGCQELLEAVRGLRPKLHIFGHVHSAYGALNTPETLFVNAALLGRYGGIDRPFVFRIQST